jgi:hypothetical protein
MIPPAPISNTIIFGAAAQSGLNAMRRHSNPPHEIDWILFSLIMTFIVVAGYIAYLLLDRWAERQP